MIAAFSVAPSGVGESVGEYVAETVRLVRESGLENETNAMFTNVEGSWEEISALLGQCMERMEEMGAPRIGLVVKIDHRPGHDGRLRDKVDAVEDRLENRTTNP